jgi:hypothetical protein
MHNMGGRAASLAVLAVFTAIYQRSKSPPPRNSSAADLENSQTPAVRSLFFAFVCGTMQRSQDVVTASLVSAGLIPYALGYQNRK